MIARIVLAAAILSCTSVLVGQAQEPTAPPPPAPALTQSSSTVDTQGIRNYLLGPGDVLDVRIFGQPDLNATAEVDSDGNIGIDLRRKCERIHCETPLYC